MGGQWSVSECADRRERVAAGRELLNMTFQTLTYVVRRDRDR
ncbi:MAG TPA: hypothetical protein VK277_03720 [Acidimicrobiales bacterium]|nr:hypothetical protein [Acidimicrobiales bacterium]